MDLTDRQALARGWSGLTAVVSLLGILLSAIVAYRADEGFFSGAWERFFNTFAFFTIQSNTLVAITSLLLYLNRNRTSTVFRIVWLTALVAISITGVVYHWLLAASQDLEGLALVSDFIVHTVVPIMAVVGFFVFGPRGLVTPAVVRLTLIFFILWSIFTIVRGEIVEWYPYPFIDVNDKGYPRVIANGIGIALFYFMVGMAYLVIDRLLTDDATEATHNPADSAL